MRELGRVVILGIGECFFHFLAQFLAAQFKPRHHASASSPGRAEFPRKLTFARNNIAAPVAARIVRHGPSNAAIEARSFHARRRHFRRHNRSG